MDMPTDNNSQNNVLTSCIIPGKRISKLSSVFILLESSGVNKFRNMFIYRFMTSPPQIFPSMPDLPEWLIGTGRRYFHGCE